jgi:uncharacterized protein YybS (DUF2232 family)
MRIVTHNDSGKSAGRIIAGIAITGAAIAISSFLPFTCFFILPLSILYCRIRFGRKNGTAIALSALLLVCVISQGVVLDIFFFFGLIFLGYTMGESFERKFSVEKTVLYSAVSVLGAFGLGLFFYSVQSGSGIIQLVTEHVSKNLEFTLKLYENMGMSKESALMFSENFDGILHDMVRLIPSMVVALTLLVVWMNLLFSRSLLSVSRLFYTDFGSLNRWKAPEPIVWVVIACGLMLLLPGSSLRLIGLNGLIALMPIYFFQGIAIVSFYFEKKRFPRLLKIFMYTIIAIQQMFLFVIIGLGFFDMWLNFRKLDRKKIS